MTDQWKELKETITELRDNDGTATQQEVCKFLANYMDVLEKQMIDPIDRVLEIIDEATTDYEALPTEIDVGREKAVISFEKKDGMLAMASMIRLLVLALKGEQG